MQSYPLAVERPSSASTLAFCYSYDNMIGANLYIFMCACICVYEAIQVIKTACSCCCSFLVVCLAQAVKKPFVKTVSVKTETELWIKNKKMSIVVSMLLDILIYNN